MRRHSDCCFAYGYFNKVEHFVSNGSSTLNGSQQRANTINGVYFYSMVMARTAQRSSLISAIITTSFHPHTTHLVQPLDLICFQPYNHFHAEAVGVARRTDCLDFNILEFFVALSTIREQTFKRTTILSAFRQTGLTAKRITHPYSKSSRHTASDRLRPRAQNCLPHCSLTPATSEGALEP